MSNYLYNFLEIATLLFFLTLDWEKPIFLPRSLWGALTARVGDYDLMARGISWQQSISFTLWLAGLAVLIELLRRIVHIFSEALVQYRKAIRFDQSGRARRFKGALVLSFASNLDALVKYFGFTTVVMLVFFFFPRLKLVSLVTYSLTNLLLDIISPRRLVNVDRGEDLLSSLVIKIFNL